MQHLVHRTERYATHATQHPRNTSKNQATPVMHRRADLQAPRTLFCRDAFTPSQQVALLAHSAHSCQSRVRGLPPGPPTALFCLDRPPPESTTTQAFRRSESSSSPLTGRKRKSATQRLSCAPIVSVVMASSATDIEGTSPVHEEAAGPGDAG